MSRYSLYSFLFIQMTLITMSLTLSALSDETGMKSLKGNIVCIEVDKHGKIEPKEEFTTCRGLMVFVGMDMKIYALTGEENDLNKLIEEPKSRMGYLPPLRIRGSVEGNQRAWILHAKHKEGEKSDNGQEQTVTGTIVCLIPDYYRGNVRPFVSTAPCNKHEPHMHVIYNTSGQVYVVHGPLNRILEIEESSIRENVTLKGTLEGNKNGWILVLK